MSFNPQNRTVLMVDDDAEDCLLVREALFEAGRQCDVRFVRDGEEMFDYLRGEGEYARPGSAPKPDLILLDLKMPRKDGLETLRELKADPLCRAIPVVVFTSSTMEADVDYCYRVGANTYVVKPSGFRELAQLLDVVGKYWFEAATLPRWA